MESTPPSTQKNMLKRKRSVQVGPANTGRSTSRVSTLVKKIARDTVTKKILSMSSQFYAVLAPNLTASFHNFIYSANLTAQIPQGQAINGRQGDEVYLTSLHLKGIIGTDVVSNGYQYRVMIVMSGEEYTATNFSATQLTYSELFLNTTGAGSLLYGTVAPINPKAITVLYDETFNLDSQVPVTRNVTGFERTIPLYRKFLYQGSGSVFGKTKNLYAVFIPCALNGADGTTPTGQIVMSARLGFKNL